MERLKRSDMLEVSNGIEAGISSNYAILRYHGGNAIQKSQRHLDDNLRYCKASLVVLGYTRKLDGTVVFEEFEWEEPGSGENRFAIAV